MKRANKTIVFLMFYIISWIGYFFDDILADNYQYLFDSYNLHELLSIIPKVSIIVSIIWIVINSILILKKKADHSMNYFTIILVLFLIIQVIYVKDNMNWIQTTEIAEITNIDKNNEKITLVNSAGRVLVITCSESMIGLLEKNNKYFLIYEYKKGKHNKGKVLKRV